MFYIRDGWLREEWHMYIQKKSEYRRDLCILCVLLIDVFVFNWLDVML
jgi:hypothetical protein